MKPVIGIVARNYTRGREWYPTIQGVFEDHVEAIIAANALPIILPITDDGSLNAQYYAGLDGLLLVGGGDISPPHYGQRPKVALDRVDVNLDQQEELLLKWALADKLPLFGICRGLQMINVVTGGNLHQSISEHYRTSINHNESFDAQNLEKAVHNMVIDRQSRLAELLGRPFVTVVSAHRQAIDGLGEGLKITARADDGVIEAVEGTGDHYIMGLQTHPEFMVKHEPVWGMLYRDFAEHSRSYRHGRRSKPTANLETV